MPMVNATTPSLPSPVARTNPSLHVAHSAAYLPKEPHAQHLSQQSINRTAAAVAQETSGFLHSQPGELPLVFCRRALAGDPEIRQGRPVHRLGDDRKEEGQVWHPSPECRFSPLLVEVLLY